MVKGDRVYINAGKYKGQTATLERRWPGASKEWTVTLDGSYNNGIVKDAEIVLIEKRKAHDSDTLKDAADLANAYKTQGEAAARRLWAEKIKGLNYGQQVILQDKMAKLIKAKATGAVDPVAFGRAKELWRKVMAENREEASPVKSNEPERSVCKFCKKPIYKEDGVWRHSHTFGPACPKHLSKGTVATKAKDALTEPIPVDDAFQVTSVGMHKVAKAKRRDFMLQASNSATEAENLRREGNLERAKKFLQQEAKWLAMAARDDEAIYKEYKAQAHDSLKPTTLLWAAFILSLIHRLGSSTTETVGPQDYDLRTYQPPKKRW